MTDPDRIVSSVPANATAARVVGRGVHWSPGKSVVGAHEAWQDMPLPMLSPPRDAPALVGLRVGRLTVLGYGGAGSDGARWVVRCACGTYGHRRAKSLRAPGAAERAMCPQCDYLEEIKRGNFSPKVKAWDQRR